jgi:hypothetical protein
MQLLYSTMLPIISFLVESGMCTPTANPGTGVLDIVLQKAKDFNFGCKISLAANAIPLTSACGKDIFDLGSTLFPVLLKISSASNQTSTLNDIINVSSGLIKNYCTSSCSPAIVKFFKAVRENVDCNNTTLIETRIGNPTAYQIASGLIVGNALVCTKSSSCIMDQIESAKDLIAQHPDKLEFGTDLYTLLHNRSFVCNECTKSQSVAVQSIPISALDQELRGNMMFLVDKINERCTLNQWFGNSSSSDHDHTLALSSAAIATKMPLMITILSLSLAMVLVII